MVDVFIFIWTSLFQRVSADEPFTKLGNPDEKSFSSETVFSFQGFLEFFLSSRNFKLQILVYIFFKLHGE